MNIGIADRFDGVVEEAPIGDIKITGHFHWWVEDSPENGGGIVAEGDIYNMVVNQGLNHALATELGAGAQIAAWYIGLVDAPTFSAFAAGDTAASHAGWTENQNYTEAVRQTWTPGAAAGQAITNPTPAVFTCNTNGTQIKGFFVASSNVKGGAAGTLWSEGAFAAGTQTIQSGQLLKCTYTANAASS
jgi:hypothetical protein